MLNFERVAVGEFWCVGFDVRVDGRIQLGDHVKKADVAWEALTAGTELDGTEGPWRQPPMEAHGCPTRSRVFLGWLFYRSATDKDAAMNNLRKVAGFNQKEIAYMLEVQDLFKSL